MSSFSSVGASGGVDVVFENVRYEVKLNNGKGLKILLNDVSGYFPSGNLIGILGPSGAGKTTLLNILSGWNTNSNGTIQLLNKHNQTFSVKNLSTYVPSENHHHNLLTVAENMEFTADLKFGSSKSKEDKNAMIDEILKKLGLYHARNTSISKLSGGERKRLSISLELIDDPPVMFFDEPTSGLDSFSSKHCIECLKELSQQGKTIVCTIHQPNESQFQMFDMIYVMSEGRCLYNGSVKRLVPLLDEIGIPCNKFHNPADYVIEIASCEYGEQYIDLMMKTCNNGKSLLPSQNIKANIEKTEKYLHPLPSQSTSTHPQLMTLTKRECIKIKRDMFCTYLRFAVSIFIGISTGAMYWNIYSKLSKITYVYMLVLCSNMASMSFGLLQTLVTIPLELSVIQKEYFNRYYSIGGYFVMKVVMNIPTTCVCVVGMNFFLYYLAGLPLELERITMFLLAALLESLVAQNVGLFIGSTTNDIQTSLVTACFFHLPIQLVSGYGMTFADFPSHLYWTTYLAYPGIGLAAQVKSVYGYNNNDLKCDVDFCFYSSGKQFLNFLGISDREIYWNFAGLLGYYVLFAVLAYITVNRNIKRKLERF